MSASTIALSSSPRSVIETTQPAKLSTTSALTSPLPLRLELLPGVHRGNVISMEDETMLYGGAEYHPSQFYEAVSETLKSVRPDGIDATVSRPFQQGPDIEDASEFASSTLGKRKRDAFSLLESPTKEEGQCLSRTKTSTRGQARAGKAGKNMKKTIGRSRAARQPKPDAKKRRKDIQKKAKRTLANVTPKPPRALKDKSLITPAEVARTALMKDDKAHGKSTGKKPKTSKGPNKKTKTTSKQAAPKKNSKRNNLPPIRSNMPLRSPIKFGSLFEKFGLENEAEPAQRSKGDPLSKESSFHKRCQIELISGPSGKAEAEWTERIASPKRKAQTITEKATAPFMRPATLQDGQKQKTGLSTAMASATHCTSYDSNKKRPRQKRPSKRASTSKTGTTAENRAPLFSPATAMQHTGKLDFVFGTSSQLMQAESPTFLRDLQYAIRESEAIQRRNEDRKHDATSGDVGDMDLPKYPTKRRKSLWEASAERPEHDGAPHDRREDADKQCSFNIKGKAEIPDSEDLLWTDSTEKLNKTPSKSPSGGEFDKQMEIDIHSITAARACTPTNERHKPGSDRVYASAMSPERARAHSTGCAIIKVATPKTNSTILHEISNNVILHLPRRRDADADDNERGASDGKKSTQSSPNRSSFRLNKFQLPPPSTPTKKSPSRSTVLGTISDCKEDYARWMSPDDEIYDSDSPSPSPSPSSSSGRGKRSPLTLSPFKGATAAGLCPVQIL